MAALKLSTLINHPGFKQALVAGNFSELPHTHEQSVAWLCRIVEGWGESGLRWGGQCNSIAVISGMFVELEVRMRVVGG